LQALIDWERSDRARMRVDLAPEIDLMTRLGDPHRRFRSVHVTGTKGKGSVCALIEAGLLNAGLRAGRYGSPHIEHVTERVSHCGQPISDPLFATALTHALDARDAACREDTPARDASWFDIVTAAAFWSFAEAKLEWAVIEVGLGGLLDSTNVVLPELAILTNVALEHTDILGKTVQAIATQKAGIIKRGRPVLTPIPPSTPAGRVVMATAKALAAELRWIDLTETSGLLANNLALARAALKRLGDDGTHSAVRGMPLSDQDLPPSVAARASLPGRLEAFDVQHPRRTSGDRHGHATRVVLDGAHVGFAVTAVIDELRRNPAHAREPMILLALGADKDADDFVRRLQSIASRVICTRLHADRPSWDAVELARICARHGITCESTDDPMRGLARCLELVPNDAWIFVTGSLHLVGVARAQLCSWGSACMRVPPAMPDVE
jgi:dihydrofolate synthase/folylpolyglutamate synthase